MVTANTASPAIIQKSSGEDAKISKPSMEVIPYLEEVNRNVRAKESLTLMFDQESQGRTRFTAREEMIFEEKL